MPSRKFHQKQQTRILCIDLSTADEMTRFIKTYLGALLLVSLLSENTQAQNTQSCLPCKFEDHLISCWIKSSANDSLTFYTDTGGKNFIYKSGLKKLKLQSSKRNLWLKSGLQEHFEAQNFPIPAIPKLYFIKEKSDQDGMLGREWFSNKSWVFNYSKQTLSLSENTEMKFQEDDIPIYFKKDSLGNRTDHLPRIDIVVDGDSLSFLFDTGAQAKLSPSAQSYLQKNELVATCFVNASTFESWKQKNPDWNVLKAADLSFGLHADMIIVPSLTIGNTSIGPVEFVKRDDSNFKVMSDLFMDQPIVGAVGGNLLALLNCFKIDYQMELVRFFEVEKP